MTCPSIVTSSIVINGLFRSGTEKVGVGAWVGVGVGALGIGSYFCLTISIIKYWVDF